MPPKPPQIKVYVVHLLDEHGKPRKHLSFQWTDPVTKRRKTQSSGCSTRRTAERAAADFERDLNAKIPRGDGLVDFSHFIEAYDENCLRTKEAAGEITAKTRGRIVSILELFQASVEPASLAEVTPAVLSEYVNGLRDAGRASTTIRTHITQLNAAIAWAVAEGYIASAPRPPKLGRQKGTRAKGRPLTTPEFIAMLRSVTPVVGRKAARSWRRLLIGLWLSGLRLDEALRLTWGDGMTHESELWIDTSGRFPLLGIVAESEKGKQDRLLPLTRDFGLWLLKTPTERRVGYVFPLVKQRHQDARNVSHVSKVICSIGEKSGVTVNARGKFASAHDLRRSFGLRWAQVPGITPAELQQLMRHEDIATTMKFYALVEATRFAEKLWNLDTTDRTTEKTQESTQDE